jgi:hypothetical protein
VNNVHKKKIILGLSLNLLLFTSIIGNNILLSSAQLPIDEPQPYRGGKLYATRLQLKQPGEEFFIDIDPTSNIVPNVKNGSDARFITTLANTGDEEMTLKGVDIFIFNSSNKQTTDISYQYVFHKALELQRNTSQTIEFERKLVFPVFDEFFTVFFSVVFFASSNTTLDLYLSPPYNFTLKSVAPEFQPPEFIVLTWFLISFFIVAYVVFGWWGNRKLKNVN